MLNKDVLETYCQVVLHKGCAVIQEQGPGEGIGSKSHSWDICPAQDFYRKAARKHQNWLKSNGLAIGIWVDENKFELVSKGV